MSKRSTGKTRQGPVVVGVVVAPPDSATSERTFLKGVCFVTDVDEWQQVESLFFESAMAMGVSPPAGFEFQAGEILYEEQRIAVIRMACHRVSRLGKKGRRTGSTLWSTSEETQSDYVPGVGLVLPQGRTYFAAMRHHGALMLGWDVRANAKGLHNSNPDVDQRLIRVTASADETRDDEGDKIRYRNAIFYANSIIAAATEIRDLLIQLKADVYTDEKGHLTALTYAVKHLLEQRVGERMAGDTRVGSFRIKHLDQRELKKRILDTVTELARAGLQIEKGPLPGSQNKKPRSVTRMSPKERKLKIQRAIDKICLATKGENNEFNEFKAEDRVTKDAVAKELGIQRPTLDNWLEKDDLDFQDLKDERIRVLSRISRKSKA